MLTHGTGLLSGSCFKILFTHKLCYMPNKKNRKAVPGYTFVPMNGYYKAKKIGISGERVKTDPAYAITRAYATEFGHVAKIAKLIRTGLLNHGQAKKTVAKLTSCLREVLYTDKTNCLGSRTLLQADLSGLIGFEFNKSVPFSLCCRIQFLVKEHSDRQQIIVEVPAFAPFHDFQEPESATNFTINFCLVRINPDEGITSSINKTMQGRSFDEKESPACEHSFDATIAKSEMLFLAVSIEWYKLVNGSMSKLSQAATSILYAKNSVK